MSLAAVIVALVAATVIFDAVLFWLLVRRHPKPTEHDRQIEAREMLLEDIARGIGRR